jgi:thiol-disulfide isomerase/thioredoxin
LLFEIKQIYTLHKGFEKEAGPLGLTISKDSISRRTELFLGNENINIQGTKEEFITKLIVTGSPNQTLMTDLDKILYDALAERKKLLSDYLSIRQAGKMNDSIKKAYWGQAGSIKMLDEEVFYRQKKFIAKNVNSYYALYLLSILKTGYKKAELQKLMDRLTPIYKRSNYTNAINVAIKNKDLNNGDKFINFKAYDKEDKVLFFSSFFSERYVLLDFSTPYCLFCLQAIEPLKKLALENPANLEIVTFYVDEEKNGYANFLDKNNKPWSVIWDKKGRFGDAYSAYHINGTPAFFLFDKMGILVIKQDGFNEDFFETVAKTIK